MTSSPTPTTLLSKFAAFLRAVVERFFPPQNQLPPSREEILKPFKGPLKEVPKRQHLNTVYGDPKVTSDGKNVTWDSKWEGKHLKTYRDMPGYEGKPVRVHKLVEPYLREALHRTQLLCPEYKIETMGCFAPRHMRHNSKLPLSVHTWAIAVDINARDNKAISYDKGKKPLPFSEEWQKTWPKGMPELFVKCFESVGFKWGGRWSTFADPQHLEMCIS